MSRVATSTLSRLRDAIADGRASLPLTRASFLDQGIHNQLEALEAALSGHSRLACLSVLDVILAERVAHAAPAPELVWTGPERAHATARDSAVVLRELFEGARHQVVLAGYDFRRGQSLLEPLFIAMRDRGVDVRFIVHFQQPDVVPPDPRAYGDQAVREILDHVWPFGEPRPRCFYDRRALEKWPKFNMHAKCVVVDGKRALVTSANFTEAGHERNIECGVLLDDRRFAEHLARQL
ncbi:MAG: phospholipase, partial [Myxococcales bacterium]|nr:phospholipase [Myxococcales bacterium]